MAKKIFVGNLPYQANEQQLREWFLANGFTAESVNISIDRLSGQPRGFGYVEMKDALARRCILACNGQDFLGRTLVINEASPVYDRRIFPSLQTSARLHIKS